MHKSFPDLLYHLILFILCMDAIVIGNEEKNSAYLALIQIEYEDLLKKYDLSCSLQSIKIAGDLRKEFKDPLNTMKILILGEDPTLSILLQEMCKDSTIAHSCSFDLIQDAACYDLIISTLDLSSYTFQQQIDYFSTFLKTAAYGYVLCSQRNYFSADEMVVGLLNEKKKGWIKTELPSVSMDNQVLIWRPLEEKKSSLIKENFYLIPTSRSQHDRAITYELSGGRFGDNLIAYCHAKWMARKQGICFLYKPFPYSDLLQLSDLDLSVNDRFYFRYHLYLTSLEQLIFFYPSTLIHIPFFSESRFEYENGPIPFPLYFYVDWEDPKFKEELKICLSPKQLIQTVPLPDPAILSIALHIRTGGDFESYYAMAPQFPLKFPPESYYLSQIRRIANMYRDRLIHIHLFTDYSYPERIAGSLNAQLQNPFLSFSWNEGSKETVEQIFCDFYSIGKFNCIIGNMSHFCIIASILGNSMLKIFPTHCHVENGQTVIDQIETTFCSHNE